MKKYAIIISIFLLFFPFLKVEAQDTIHIYEVVKTESLLNTFRNSNVEKIDSSIQTYYQNSSIEDVLEIKTSAQIKTYGGLGNLSSISLRGSGGNHVAVSWNGFAINSISAGSTDLSLIQTGFFEDVKLIPGASSSLYGNGTFGGALELNNSFVFKKDFNVSIGSEIGSFETFKYLGQTSFSNDILHYKLSINNINAKNNFPFTDNYKFEKPLERRKHNSLNSLNLIQNFILKLPKNNIVESGIWYLLKNKEIPEIAGSEYLGNKMQKDSIFRTYLRWKNFGKKHLLTASSAYFSEYLHYTDKLNSFESDYYINSKIRANVFLGDFSYRYYFKNRLIVDFAGFINKQQISTSNYKKIKISETNYSLIYSLKYDFLGFDFKFSFRNEFFDREKYIPLFNVGLSKKLLQNKVILKSNFSNKFKRATFNDKYWQPGGNINLKHEKGDNFEISFKYIFGKIKTDYFNATFYQSRINDMIQWIPIDGNWTAVNNKEVRINGVETSFEHSFKTKLLSNKIYLSYNYTNALLTNVYSVDKFVSQKLVYTPKNNTKLFFVSSFKNISLSFAINYTDKRYTTQINNENNVLKSYFLSNIYASYKVDIKNFNLTFKAKFLNIFDKQYEHIKSYPSSGRAVYFSIVLAYNKK